jgi:hypothetical protein
MPPTFMSQLKKSQVLPPVFKKIFVENHVCLVKIIRLAKEQTILSSRAPEGSVLFFGVKKSTKRNRAFLHARR